METFYHNEQNHKRKNKQGDCKENKHNHKRKKVPNNKSIKARVRQQQSRPDEESKTT